MLFSQEELYNTLASRCGEGASRKLTSARVAILGLGGLGSHIALTLARMGVGCLHIIDFDKIELSNINRQAYTLSQVGLYKTEALTALLHEINPYTKVIASNTVITAQNAVPLLEYDTIIAEAFDSADAKSMLFDALSPSLKEKKLVMASGMAGTFDANLIRTRKLTENVYICGDEVSDVSKFPMFASRVTLCASHQAHMILRLILEN